MAKRQGGELNHDNWDQVDDEEEEPGSFKPVSDTELQNRVIKRAKRSTRNLNSDPETGISRSPFSAFGGFARSSSKPAFSFQLSAAKSDSSVSMNIEKKSEERTKNGCNTTFSAATESVATSSSKPSSSSGDKLTSGRSLEYFRQLQSLNESVLKWVQMHFDKNPCCDFTPVFNDYRSHLEKIDRMYPAQNSADKLQSSETSFKIPQPLLSTRADSSISSTSQPRFFESAADSTKQDDDKEMLYGAGFASNTTNTSTFSFGIKESPTSTSTGSKHGPTSSSQSNKSEDKESPERTESPMFSFALKKSSDDSPPKSLFGSQPKPFSFSFSAAAAAPAGESSSQSNKDDEYVPPKNEFSAVSEDDAVYSKRCKLFFQKSGTYMDKGVGTLYLKPLDGKTQLLIRADTNLGNVLLNIMLSSSLPMERSGKNNVLVVCVPNPPLDAKDPDSTKAVPLLIRVKTANDADELLEKLNEYKS